MWKDLSMQQRADLMDIYLSHGVTSLDEMRNHYDSRNQYSEGGSIHIKPENRGKFTRLKERTGHSASWFKAHGTPAQKKMATFELNERKRKHGLGGNLFETGGTTDDDGILGNFVSSLGQKIVKAGKAMGLIESDSKPKVYVSKPTGRRFKTKEEAQRDAYNYYQAEKLTKQTKNIPVKHIGSDNKNPVQQRRETWNQFWQQEPVMQHAVDSIANRYGVDPNALKYRLNTEGFTEGMIHQRNDSVKNNRPVDRGYALLNQNVADNNYAWYNNKDKEWKTFTGPEAGFMMFGLDDAADYITGGQAHLINEQWYDGHGTNEKGRPVHYATGKTIADNIGLMGSTLKMFTDQAREDFPNASEEDIARYGLAYYNRGRRNGKSWVKNGAKGYYYR